MPAKKKILIFGDIFTIAILTIIGFATHDEAAVSFIPRMGTTFFPLLIGWLLIAPWFDLFDDQVVSNPKLIWRYVLAMFFVAPLAIILRAAWLHSAATPLFALILGSINALGMVVWRGIYLILTRHVEK
ncbi:MAG TPA: DUF3054 domain-containing protein [Anaerolineales bacterium]|nr:DUF3054 domain-containing protein [Anaerolineales bacterium]